MTTRTPAARLAESASQALAPFYDLLRGIADEVVSCRPSRTPLTEAHLSRLHRQLADRLREEPAVWGMGFVAAPFVVDGMERYMAWWQHNHQRVTRLRLNFDPTSIDVYDYLQMDWYQLAKRGQERVAYGPYVDYSGSDMYTITVTIPIVAEEVFLGVAGADLVVGEVERRLLDILRQTDQDALVVNTERRVIAANTPRWFVGSRLAAMPVRGPSDDPTAFCDVDELPLGNGWMVAIAWPAAGPNPS